VARSLKKNAKSGSDVFVLTSQNHIFTPSLADLSPRQLCLLFDVSPPVSSVLYFSIEKKMNKKSQTIKKNHKERKLLTKPDDIFLALRAVFFFFSFSQRTKYLLRCYFSLFQAKFLLFFFSENGGIHGLRKSVKVDSKDKFET
jgi:hypothetical protein